MKQKIMEFMNGMMAGFIKENDFKIKCMDQVKLPDQMGNFMKDIIKMIKNMIICYCLG